MTVGTFTVTAVRRVGGKGGVGGERGVLPAGDKTSALIDAVGDATDITDAAELDVHVEWAALASSNFAGGTVSVGKAAAPAPSDADAGAASVGGNGGDGGGLGVAPTDVEQSSSWGPRSFGAARRASRRSAAAILGDHHSAAPAVGAALLSPVVGAGAPTGAFASHAPMGSDGSLSSKLRKSMALH